MANPLLQALSMASMNKGISSMSELYKLMTSNNPMMLFNQIAKNNPQLNECLNLINRGINPQDLFYKLCNKRGINPQDIMRNINTILKERR